MELDSISSPINTLNNQLKTTVGLFHDKVKVILLFHSVSMIATLPERNYTFLGLAANDSFPEIPEISWHLENYIYMYINIYIYICCLLLLLLLFVFCFFPVGSRNCIQIRWKTPSLFNYSGVKRVR